jgi:ribosomal protein S18 acetylase RimI-like enzyme
MPPEQVGADELDAVVELIASQQVRPDRNVTYLGHEPAGITAELRALDPPWFQTATVVRDGDAIVGICLLDVEADGNRVWVFGPWVAGDEDTWATHARELVDAALTRRPPGELDVELSGDIANTRLAALASELVLPARSVACALEITADAAGDWPSSSAIRPVRAGDLDAIRPVHDAEFPNTYAGPEELLTEYTAIVVERDGVFAGYAAGQVRADGEGFIDYIAVAPHHRGHGLGRLLTTTLTRVLLDAAPEQRVALVVTEERRAARALYESIGFREALAFAAYRGVVQVPL